ncbi:MAG: hypothetical protein SGBAC_006762 [Bacillariaceae sp.]
MLKVWNHLCSLILHVLILAGESNPTAESGISAAATTFRQAAPEQTSFLRGRDLEEMQLLEEEGKIAQEEEQQPPIPASNRLAFAESSSGRLVFITAGSLVGVLFVYFLLHDHLRKACCSKTAIKRGIEAVDDDEKDIKQGPAMDQTTRTRFASVDDLSKSDEKSDDSGDSALVK